MTIEDYRAALDCISGATPLEKDCGALCGAACCLPDEDGAGGVCLLPVEEALLRDVPWAKLCPDDAAMGRPMLMCTSPCARELRPFLCRIFPLCPVFDAEGALKGLRIDARARALCPLARGGVKGLDPAFVRGVTRACKRLLRDGEGAAFLRRWAAIEEEFRKPFL